MPGADRLCLLVEKIVEDKVFKKEPSCSWYPDKALADTRRLSWKAKGMYRELLDIIWMQFQDTCSIPDDDSIISAELGVSLEEWQEIKKEIMWEYRPLFQIKEGRLFSKGMWKAKETREKYRTKQRENGEKGGRPKTQDKSKENQIETQNQSKPNPDETQTEAKDNPTQSQTLTQDEPKQKLSVSVPIPVSFSVSNSKNTPPSEGMQKHAPPEQALPEQTEGSSDSEEVNQGQCPKADTSTRGKTNLRLEIFAEEYQKAKRTEYIIGDYRKEGGAAKRTISKIPDDKVYRRAVRAYLASTDKRLVENGHGFMWFIYDLNRWASKAQSGQTPLGQGEMHVERDSKYADVYE